MSADQPEPKTNPYAEPSQATEPEAPPPLQRHLPKKAGPARRLAGGLMLANAVLVFIEMAVLPRDTKAIPGLGIVPAILDIVIGITLLRGSASLATLAIVRAALGMTAGAALRAQEGPWVIAYQVLFCGSLLGLLIGEAERIRTAIAGSLTGVCLLAEVAGITSILTGGNPLTPYLLAMSGEIETPAVEKSDGRTAPYELSFPNKKWYLRKQEITAKENPLADRWFIRPDKDAHILVVAEHAPGTALPIDPYVDAVLQNVQQDTPGLTVYWRAPWPAFPDRGRLVKVRGTKNGVALEWHYAFVTAYDRAYYVLGLATKEAMPSVEQELRAIFDSLKLPAAVLDALPADVDPAKVTTIRGKLLPYSMTAPNDRWHFRLADVVKKDNPVIDQWLTRPEIDAHVLVIAEEVDERLTLELGPYVDAVLTTARKGTTRFDELRREPWGKFPKEGLRLRVSLSRSGTDLEYDYGLFTRKNRAFQVVGFSSKMAYDSARDDIARLVDSFEPPP